MLVVNHSCLWSCEGFYGLQYATDFKSRHCDVYGCCCFPGKDSGVKGLNEIAPFSYESPQLRKCIAALRRLTKCDAGHWIGETTQAGGRVWRHLRSNEGKTWSGSRGRLWQRRNTLMNCFGGTKERIGSGLGGFGSAVLCIPFTPICDICLVKLWERDSVNLFSDQSWLWWLLPQAIWELSDTFHSDEKYHFTNHPPWHLQPHLPAVRSSSGQVGHLIVTWAIRQLVQPSVTPRRLLLTSHSLQIFVKT